MKKRGNPMTVAICFFLLIICTAQASPGIGKDDVLPPDILPIVILEGPDYEMGVQYGRQAGHYIEKNKAAAWASALQQYDRETVIRTLKANQHYIQEYTPECIDIMKGIADGAAAAGYDVTYVDIMLLNCTLPKPETSMYPQGAEDDSLPPKKGCSVCSAWGMATKNGRLIGMDTLDGGPEAMYGVIIVAFPDDGNAYICGASAGEVGDHFLMNNKGLMIGNSGGGGSPRDIDNNYGLAWSCSLPHLVRYAGSAQQARDMVMPWQINIPENFHFVDVKGNAFVVEKTAAVQAVRKPGDFGEKDFLFSTNNYLHETMKVTKEGDFIQQHGGYGAYAAPRNRVLWDMLHNYHGHVDVEFIKMILRFPGNPPPYAPEDGWDAKICRPTNSWISVILPHDGNEGIAHICTGPAGRVIHASTASDGSEMRSTYQHVHGTHTFFRLRLAEAPKAVVEQTKSDAKDDIATAYNVFMQMRMNDAGYAFLEDLYALANTEYFRGCDALNNALLSSGDNAIASFSKAATAFTRSQAHAMQVYEALVPPATSPSDLGLRPFGGDWAQWETRVGKAE